MLKVADIATSEIQQLHTGTTRIWYRVGKNIHVTVGQSSKGWRYHCLTCNVAHCAHARAVKRFVEVP